MTYRIGDEDPAAGGSDDPVEGQDTRDGARSKLWWLAGVAAVGAFVVAVVSSASKTAVPTGGSGGMSGMSMPMDGSAPLDLRVRDIDGASLRLPGGRPGAVVVIEANDCGRCVTMVRRVGDVAAKRRRPVTLTALSMEAGDTRAAIERFAEKTGQSRFHYVVDDRNGMLVGMLGASSMGQILVYDRDGRLHSVRRPSAAGVEAALRSVGA